MSKKIEITKEQLMVAIKNGFNSEKKLVDCFNTSLSTIRRRLRENNIKLFKRKFDETRFMELYNNGLYDTAIAKELGVSIDAINSYRHKLGLPKNFKYKRDVLRESILTKYSEVKSIEEVAKILNLDERLVDMFLNTSDVNYNYKLSESEEQIIIGSLLGDGNISYNKSGNQAHFVFAHSAKQKEYCIWKTEQLKNIMYFERSFFPTEQIDKRFNKIRISYRALSKELSILKDYCNKWYSYKNAKNIKHINKEDLFKLNALGLAVWFQDDGYREKNTGYILCTQCFSKEDLKLIVEYFDKIWNIDVTIRTNNEIYIGSRYRDKFTSIIKPYVCSSCKYKLIESL